VQLFFACPVYLYGGKKKMSANDHKEHVPWFLWPFWAIWKLLTFIIEMTGRLVGLILGAVFLLVGIILTITVVGAVIGIPLALFGVLLMVRCLF
jgi:hypothetical protein